MKAGNILKKIEEDKSNIEFMSTGFKKLDKWLDGGFLKKEVIVIGGSTGVGKSYIAGQLQQNIAHAGFKTAYFSLEISNEMMVSRLVGAHSNIKSTNVISGHMNLEEHMKYNATKAKLEGLEDQMEFYDDVYDFNTLAGIVQKEKFEFIVVDFLQILSIQGRDEYERMTTASTLFQKLAKETGCCIVLLSQLSNEIATMNIEKMSYPQYKGSGAIAMVADQGYYLLRKNDDLGLSDLALLLLKNRRGPRNTQPFEFRFDEPGGLIHEF